MVYTVWPAPVFSAKSIPVVDEVITGAVLSVIIPELMLLRDPLIITPKSPQVNDRSSLLSSTPPISPLAVWEVEVKVYKAIVVSPEILNPKTSVAKLWIDSSVNANSNQVSVSPFESRSVVES